MADHTGTTDKGTTGLDIAYDELKEAYKRLYDQEARLNTQATFIIGAASVVVGAVAGILGAAAPLHAPARGLVHGGVGLDVALYLVVVLYAWRVYTVDVVEEFYAGDFMEYVDAAERDTKVELNRARLKLYERSAYKLGKKRLIMAVAAGALPCCLITKSAFRWVVAS